MPLMAATPSRTPDHDMVEEFKPMLDALFTPEVKIGLAVSGGPDSLALLLLAAAARPGKVEAATVDHGLRPESAAEAAMVAKLCAELGVPHQILTVKWAKKPKTGIPERARTERYALLRDWATERGLGGLATAHHLDDQVETFLMRLNRGSGVRGLGAMRRTGPSPAGGVPIARPMLGMRRWQLEALCLDSGVMPVDDPSNDDPQFARSRMRAALEEAKWLDPVAISLSASIIAEADVALTWTTKQVWQRSVKVEGQRIQFNPDGIPREIRRRVLNRVLNTLGHESADEPLRAREVNELLLALANGRKSTLRGVLCIGGDNWLFKPAPPRVATAPAAR
ncbi:MAG: tRNA lysidine(34) synthetase TilS [Sphingomicrobium sp.]